MSNALPSASPPEAKALVDRIAASASFERSPRLRALFRYIAEASLTDPSAPLTEQQIGVAVFNRPPQFDTTSDTIVRVQVSQLRKRIEHYYLTEGENETLLLDIPRGGYNAVFRPRASTPPPAAPFAETVAVVAPPSVPVPRRDWRIPALLACVAVLGAACVFMGFKLWRGEPAPGDGPTVRALWSSVIRPGQKTSVVLADPVFGFLQDSVGTPMDLERYLRHDPQQWVKSGSTNPQLESVLQMLALRQYTSIGDVTVVRRILALFPPPKGELELVWARNYNARAAASENAVFLGSSRSNPWVQIYASRLNFQFDYDEAAHKVIVRNLRPAAGESETYRISGEGAGVREGYSVLAVLPNAAGTGHVLLLAGSDMEATEAVGRVATTESELAPIARKVLAGGAFSHVEILFRTRRLGGAPQEIQMVALRRRPN